MIAQCWSITGCCRSASRQLALDCIHQQGADIGAEGIVDLANAGRAGHVDFGQVLTDHVQAYEQQAFFTQCRANLGCNPAVLFA